MSKQVGIWAWLMVALLIAACDTAGEAALTPSATPARLLATAFISPTPNPDQVRATQLAVTPTVSVPTATVQPSPSPFVGVFIGEAERQDSSVHVEEAFFAPDISVFAQPTANAARCGVVVDRAYVTAWQTTPDVNRELGCPIQAAFGFFGTVQVFENGVMYRRDDTRELWAITTDGVQGTYDYVENLPQVEIQGMSAPNGLLPPQGDFAIMWLNVEGLRDRLGYARTEAQSDVALGAQRFTSGTFLLDANAGQSYALTNDGRVFGPFAAPEADEGTGTPSPDDVQVISTSEAP